MAITTTATTRKVTKGANWMAARVGFSRPRIARLMARKAMNPTMPPQTGERNQLATIWPILPQ